MRYYYEYAVGECPYIADEKTHKENIKREKDNENFQSAQIMERYQYEESLAAVKKRLAMHYRGDRNDAIRALRSIKEFK
jgi:hypothetical protein